VPGIRWIWPHCHPFVFSETIAEAGRNQKRRHRLDLLEVFFNILDRSSNRPGNKFIFFEPLQGLRKVVANIFGLWIVTVFWPVPFIVAIVPGIYLRDNTIIEEGPTH
jgi:hypothetical protein